MPNSNSSNDKSMLGEFISTVFKFAVQIVKWALWAFFRAGELIFGGLASWIKNNLTQ